GPLFLRLVADHEGLVLRAFDRLADQAALVDLTQHVDRNVGREHLLLAGVARVRVREHVQHAADDAAAFRLSGRCTGLLHGLHGFAARAPKTEADPASRILDQALTVFRAAVDRGGASLAPALSIGIARVIDLFALDLALVIGARLAGELAGERLTHAQR